MMHTPRTFCCFRLSVLFLQLPFPSFSFVLSSSFLLPFFYIYIYFLFLIFFEIDPTGMGEECSTARTVVVCGEYQSTEKGNVNSIALLACTKVL